MSKQSRQLDIMAMGGFDIHNQDSVTGTELPDSINPERLVLIKEQLEDNLRNPCIGCVHEFTSDPYILDHCHYTCDDTVDSDDTVDVITLS